MEVRSCSNCSVGFFGETGLIKSVSDNDGGDDNIFFLGAMVFILS